MDDVKDVHAQALADFARCRDAEARNRNDARELIRFVNLSEQWPDDVRRARERDGRPCLTVNKVKKLVRQVCNEARQNKPSIKIKPVDYQSDNATADILSGIMRNIEYISNADAAYDTAIEHAATGGVGYLRVGIDYAYDDAFELDIKIERVADQFSVWGDPDSLAEDSNDWNVAFVTEWMDKDAFADKYGDAEQSNFDSGDYYQQLPDGWRDGDRVMVAEYWTREPSIKTIMLLSDGNTVDADVYSQHAIGFLASGITPVNQREVRAHKVMQRIVSGAEVLEENEFPGCYIPIIPVYGNDFIVDGQRYLRGLAYDSMDSQRMYNYWRTVSTEMVALAPKAPWIARQGSLIDAARWERSGQENYAYLEYRGDMPPQRQPFDPSPMGAVNEAMSADGDIYETAGMTAERPEQQMGSSGAAVWAKKASTDTNTFHFVDNLVRAIRHMGRVIVGIIPHVYNQQRIMRVIGEDGEQAQVEVNNGIYDLTAGKYDVVVTAGASYASRREEAAYQMSELLRTYPDAAPIVAPLLAKNLDWPEADKIMEQFEAMEAAKSQPPPPPQPTPAEQLFAQVEAAKVQQKHAYDQRKLDIDAYKAETDRAQAMATGMTPEQVQAIVVQTINDLINSNNL